MSTDGIDGASVELVLVVCFLSLFSTAVGGVTGFGTALVFFSLWRVVDILTSLDLGVGFVRADPVLALVVLTLGAFITFKSWKDAYPNLVVGLVPGLAILPWFVSEATMVSADSSDHGVLQGFLGFGMLLYVAMRSCLLRITMKTQPSVDPDDPKLQNRWEEQIFCSYICPNRYPPEEEPRRTSSHTSPGMFMSYNTARLFWGQVPPNEQDDELSGRVAASIPSLTRSWRVTGKWLCSLPFSGIFWGALACGAAAGSLGWAHGTGDVSALLYFTMLPLSKQQLRASFAVTLLLTQPVYIARLASEGMFHWEDLFLYVAVPAVALLGAFAGDFIHRQVNKSFTLIVSLVLLLSASVAFLSPMALDTTYGVVAVSAYISLTAALAVVYLWDSTNGSCVESGCLEEQREHSRTIKPLALITISDNPSLNKIHNDSESRVFDMDVMSTQALCNGTTTYGTMASKPARGTIRTSFGVRSQKCHNSPASPICKKQPVSPPRRAQNIRGIPYVSVAMRDTARDAQFRSAGSSDTVSSSPPPSTNARAEDSGKPGPGSTQH